MVEPRTKEKAMREADENGRLAVLVKQGDTQAASALWERVDRLIYKLMARFFPLCQRCGIEPDDLRQAGYFAMMRAVNAYDPARGSVIVRVICSKDERGPSGGLLISDML